MMPADGGQLAIAADAASTATPPTPDDLGERLIALAELSLERLRDEWRRLHRGAPPPQLSRDLLRRSIAHRLQEEALGGVPPAVQRRLASLARTRATDGEPAAAPTAIRLKPGTTLVREWHGRTYTVVVLEKGFEHEGRRYASLTQLARVITGAHWSGPRFFGLLRRAKPAIATSQGAADAR
ncbi:MAG TPA: DUF2924 domain-containing protein [Crenalkalicoccus sp.]|jgi:hypothetical protein|nr:DUF2924 domain-containing protein [Crenalkalicoccus sp.]